MILATDLDRTLLPNGSEHNDKALPEFFDVVKDKKLTLVYVTGRDFTLFKEAKKKFGIKNPNFLIGDVGTKMYKKEGEEMKEDLLWTEYIKENTPEWNIKKIKESIGSRQGLKLQEKEKQNDFKLSYYVTDLSQKHEIISYIKQYLNTHLNTALIYSVDPIKNVGLVDILPKIATKVTALEFLRARLGLEKEDIIYAGDSGNDILPLTNGYKSILVKNTRDEVKQEVLCKAKEKGTEKNIYIAKGTDNSSGNYSSGILEGLKYFGVI